MKPEAAPPALTPTSLFRASDETLAFPGLERVGAQFALGLADVIGSNGGVGTKLTCGETTIATFAEWRDRTSASNAVCRFRMAPLKGGMLLSVPQQYVSELVDRFYGGDGIVPSPRAELSAAEERYFARLGGLVVPMLAAAWAEMVKIEPTVAKVDHSGSLPTLVADTQQVAVQHFVAESIDGKQVAIDVVFPLAMLRAVPQLVATPDSEEASQIDPVWQTSLSDAVMQVRLPVRTIFARPELPLSQLLTLQPGDIIPVCLPNQVPVTVAGRVFARGSVGDSNGRTAIKIERIEEGSASYE
ncbi:MAG: FliM/FliN family flagellar motor switch protein [Sphingomonadales bacterium]|nr:FliM/FliN family flagellar motor switch protein [Sphingomonadales bacterium]MBP7135449.1 FliM/FliN family flagellar motor switch protein [Sphingomonadaceae bacterium]MBK6492856.1 FliM/FliN family flagellar motor switch protein [Sphingomonadales bacterium]MBK6720273.1 FliM/FliN family flagellar motor switch protein [Sphingomonadales bacterium]MBK8272908.1 FliM/FliN family flagellar motor switch protein [Sphingomonadales bacterium]